MQKPKKRNLASSPKNSEDWLKFIDEYLPRLVIPVGALFQAAVPGWKDPSHEPSPSGCYDSDSPRWLGTRIWPLQNKNALTSRDKVGKGRPDLCSCSSPGSAQCVKHHISEARKRLQSDVGPAYKSWKFDEMGENVGKSWTSNQKAKFYHLVKTNPLSEGKNFLKLAELSFPSKTRKDIVSYYLNVNVPQRIRILTKSGCKVLDSDDDGVGDVCTVEISLKRSRPSNVDVTQLARSHYLTGRR